MAVFKDSMHRYYWLEKTGGDKMMLHTSQLPLLIILYFNYSFEVLVMLP